MDFDVDGFLQQPLVARVATAGPTVRPTWFLWEDRAFWIITGPWSRLADHVDVDPHVAVVVDVCDIATGFVRQVNARGVARIVPFDVPRGRRKLVRYLGSDESRWDGRFRRILDADPAVNGGPAWVHLQPDRLVARDLSYEVSSGDRR